MEQLVQQIHGELPKLLEFKSPWFLAYTKPRQEQVAQFNLQQQAYHTYLPLYKTIKKTEMDTATGEQAVFEPMFARYIFFRPSSSRQSVASVRSTRGVNSLVSFGFETATIRPETLETIRRCEQERNAMDITANLFKVGDKIRLRSPALQSLSGLVQSVSAKRIKLLLEILGQQQVVEVEHHKAEFA